MCYGTNCGREGGFGTCYHPEDCIMRAIERDAEENLAVRLAGDTALSREHFPCPNCRTDIRAGHVSDAEVVGLWIEKLDARRVA